MNLADDVRALRAHGVSVLNVSKLLGISRTKAEQLCAGVERTVQVRSKSGSGQVAGPVVAEGYRWFSCAWK